MEIGISTASFFSKETTESSLELLNKFKIPVCEVFLSTFYEYKDAFIDELLERKGSTRVFSIHTLNQQFEPELFNPVERTRLDCENIFNQVAKCGGKLDAKYYTFHGPAKFKKLPYVHNYPKIGKRVEELCDMVYNNSGGKTELCYENVHWTYFNTPEYFDNLKPYTRVDTCLDIKQAMLSDFDIYDYIKSMGSRLKNVHLCDFDSNRKLGIPGQGTFDFVKLFATLIENGYEGPAMIEVYANDYSSYDELLKSYDFLTECLFKANNYGGI